MTYLNIEYGADLTIVRNLFGGFSLGLNPYVMHDPQENYLLRTGTLIGAEWLLVPFLKTDAGNIGARYEVGAEHQVYELPTERMVSLGRAGNTFDFLRHRLRLFGAWHFPRVDLDGGVTAQSHQRQRLSHLACAR